MSFFEMAQKIRPHFEIFPNQNAIPAPLCGTRALVRPSRDVIYRIGWAYWAGSGLLNKTTLVRGFGLGIDHRPFGLCNKIVYSTAIHIYALGRGPIWVGINWNMTKMD